MSLAPDANVALDKDSLIAPVVESDERSTIRTSSHVTYSYASATWLALLATPLILFPRILSVVFASLLTATPEAEGTPELIRQLNILERSLAGLAGISCLTLAAVLVVQVSRQERSRVTRLGFGRRFLRARRRGVELCVGCGDVHYISALSCLCFFASSPSPSPPPRRSFPADSH